MKERYSSKKEESILEKDWSLNREEPHKSYVDGIMRVDGDGTVPLLSLGYVTNVLWKKKCCPKCAREIPKHKQSGINF